MKHQKGKEGLPNIVENIRTANHELVTEKRRLKAATDVQSHRALSIYFYQSAWYFNTVTLGSLTFYELMKGRGWVRSFVAYRRNSFSSETLTLYTKL